MRTENTEGVRDSYVCILTEEQLAYRRSKAADPYAPGDGLCRFGVGTAEAATCNEEAIYEWHATRSDPSGPGWHYEICEPVCAWHAAERMGKLF